MAERRMFTKKITDDENFMTLSSSAQALYLHLSMCADDDGFSNQVSVCMFKAHASVQDLQALLEKRYIYQFENGVIVIKHWRMANALRKDRYTPTVFKEELARLRLKNNGVYTITSIDENFRLPFGCHVVADCLPQDSIGKDSIDNINTCAFPEEIHEGEEEFFEQIWKLYPIKKGKGQVSKTKKKVLQKIGFEEIRRCVERYVSEMTEKKKDKQYWQNGSTFFNSGYVDYLDKNYCTEEVKVKPEPNLEQEPIMDLWGDD